MSTSWFDKKYGNVHFFTDGSRTINNLVKKQDNPYLIRFARIRCWVDNLIDGRVPVQGLVLLNITSVAIGAPQVLFWNRLLPVEKGMEFWRK